MDNVLLVENILKEDGRFELITDKSFDGTITYILIYRISREDENSEVVEEDLNVNKERMYVFRDSDFTVDGLVKNISRNLKAKHFSESQKENRQILYDILIGHTREGKIINMLYGK